MFIWLGINWIMDFYALEAFMALSRTLHFSRAAVEINMSPSALSRLISRLEEELGTLLFDRNNRQVLLTEEGKIFLKFAQDELNRRSDLQFELSKTHDVITGTLHLYASVTACYTIVPLFVKILAKKYPGIHLSVETGDPAGAEDAVRQGYADLAVAAIHDERSVMFETVRVAKSPLVFAASTTGKYTEVSGSPQDIVSSVPLILPKVGLARTRFDKWIKSRNVKPVIAAETGGNEAILALVHLGLGIGLVPRIVLQNGPYQTGFVIHEAGNALGYYDIGFIRKASITGTKSSVLIQQAVEKILHKTDWKSLTPLQ